MKLLNTYVCVKADRSHGYKLGQKIYQWSIPENDDPRDWDRSIAITSERLKGLGDLPTRMLQQFFKPVKKIKRKRPAFF